LKRKKPLVSRKGLERGVFLRVNAPIKKKTRLTAKKLLSPRSKKTKEIYKKRFVFVASFLEKNPRCQAQWDDFCSGKSVDVHEVLPRGVGGAIVSEDLEQFMAVCRYCHTMITDNPAEAHRRGFRKWSWEK
jgi:hypothetical protein